MEHNDLPTHSNFVVGVATAAVLDERNAYSSIFQQYEKVIIDSLITSFGLDFLIQDHHGGDVDTIHNVRKIGQDELMGYKNSSNESAYNDRPDYDARSYHAGGNFQHTKHEARETWQETYKDIDDQYQSGKVGFYGHTNTISPDRKAELDHIIECKSISQMFKGSSGNSSETDSEKTDKENSTIWDKYKYSDITETRNFNHKQVQRIIFSETSDRNWELAYPHITNLIKLLNITDENKDISSIDININYEFDRALPAEAQILKGSFSVPIYTFGDESKGNKENGYKIGNLSEAIRMCYDQSIILNRAYSPPIRLTSGPEISSFEDVSNFEWKDVELTFLGCVKESPTKNNYFNSYFTFKAFNEDNTTEPIEFHIFNDQISETTQGYSVITFYITFVLLVGSYVRDYLASEPETIMLEEMPHAKKIVDLCEGIKIARYGYDFRNEEYLYTILIELMRSPDYLKILTDSSLDYFRSREKLTKDDD